jgi:hypothetical protein
MTRTLPALLLLLIAICQCNAATKEKEDEAKANWASLLVAIAEKDQVRANAFVGRIVYAEGGRESYLPPLRLSHKLADGRLLVIRLTAKFPSNQAKREVTRVLKWTAAFVDARVMGPVRSVDVNRAEIVIEPVTAGVTAAT